MSDAPSPNILFEDSDLVVVDKPAGWVVNDAPSVKAPTLQAWHAQRLSELPRPATSEWSALVPADFSEEYGSPQEIMRERQGLVHRLDKETSGCVVLAKNPGSLVALLMAFRLRQIDKTYHCLVHNQLRTLSGQISTALARSGRGDRRRINPDPTGRDAVTEYQVERLFPAPSPEQCQRLLPQAPPQQVTKLELSYAGGFSFVKCHPLTGRMHQIRVHMGSINHPIVGDALYTGRKRAKLDRIWCDRHFLHASTLQFQHPRTHQTMTFSAPLPPQLSDILAVL